MLVGINEVILYGRSSGTRQRELNLLPHLLAEIEAEPEFEAIIYVAKELEKHLLDNLLGNVATRRVIRSPLSATPTYKRIVGGLRYWPKQVSQDSLDLFHTNYFPIPRLPIPVVLTVNDVRFLHYPATYRLSRRLFLRLFVPRALHDATHVITISHDTKNDLVNHFGVESNKIDVIHIPADHRFQPIGDKRTLDTIRIKYQLPQEFILFVGHLEPRKNLARLIKAFAKLRSSSLVQHDLVILGKPAFGYEPVLEAVTKFNLESAVLFTGYVDDADLPAVYTLADLVAFPSLHEGFGMPILEAMGCGTPVLTSDYSALPEVAGEAALLVDPRSVDSIASGIEQILTDHALHSKLTIKGLRRIEDFSPAVAAVKYLDVYRKVLCK